LSKPIYYWDSCTWIGLINQESGKAAGCKYVMEQAQKGDVQILASYFTLAEVYKTRCDEPYKYLAEEKDIVLEEFFEQEFIKLAQVDRRVAKKARELLRYFPCLNKPQDAVHLATAVIYNSDELHTFDGTDLICLNGLIKRADGGDLLIRKPPDPPVEITYKTSLLDLSKDEIRYIRTSESDPKKAN